MIICELCDDHFFTFWDLCISLHFKISYTDSASTTKLVIKIKRQIDLRRGSRNIVLNF